jgi:hypothetical protein
MAFSEMRMDEISGHCRADHISDHTEAKTTKATIASRMLPPPFVFDQT